MPDIKANQKDNLKGNLKDNLMDHDADGIREYDNRLPRWWLYGFYLTILMACVYFYYYQIYTGPDWNVLWYGPRGQVQEYAQELRQAKLLGVGATKTDYAKFTLLTDATSLKIGDSIFHTSNLCYTCHRADLGGLVGPNLTDKYWLHGGRLQDIMTSIRTGYPQKGMLPFGNNNRLTDEQVRAVASFIISRQGSNPPDPKPIDADHDKAEEIAY